MISYTCTLTGLEPLAWWKLYDWIFDIQVMPIGTIDVVKQKQIKQNVGNLYFNKTGRLNMCREKAFPARIMTLVMKS